ncbi:TetR/AcrR family transcriptional regulator [Thalassobacillus hwangdonensis]|uniref:TetR/AcrR family transcriptional regulator n=1 Tax=Thalassobacillus hwangdonensis TaxID=546108 RepID=A0ABW3L214_9BACI
MSPKVSREHLLQRRADIMQAAEKVFIENGYERTTMKHIMDEAQVSRGGLYQYFSNKEDLFQAILEEGLEEEAADSIQLLEGREGQHWELLLSTLFGESMKPDDQMDPLAPSKLEYFITGRNDERRREYGEKRYKIGVNVYAEIIKAGQQSGEFRSTYDPELLAQSIITYIDGLALDHAILPGKVVKLQQQSELFVDYLKNILGVDE